MCANPSDEGCRDSHGSDDRSGQPANRPYPTQYAFSWVMRDGTRVAIRPIRPEDEPLVARFHETLSEDTVHLRYWGTLKLGRRVSHQRLVHVCFADYDREIPLVVDYLDPQ